MFLLLTKEIKAGGPSQQTPWSSRALHIGMERSRPHGALRTFLLINMAQLAQARADALPQGAKRVQPIHSG